MKKILIKKIEKKLDKNVKKLGYNSNNFIILDDDTLIEKSNLSKVINEIEKYDYKVNMVYMKEVAKKVEKYINDNNCLKDIDTVILLGEGGKRFFKHLNANNIFLNKEVYSIKWSRLWDKDKSKYFITNIDEYDIKNKKVLIIEDVVASGGTLLNIDDYLQKSNNTIELLITCLIQECSPLINKSFCKTIAGEVIKEINNGEDDPFWYPPIYSLRHLIYGDEEMPKIYDSLNKRYFNNEDNVERIIKKVR